MTVHAESGTVVVGVGGSCSDDAVEWAAAEAAARQSPLLLVHAARWPALHIDSCGWIPVVAAPPAIPMTAEGLLCAAVRRAQAVAPELEISACVLTGGPSRILLAQSRRAGLLVLGGRRRVRAHRPVTGSRAGRLSARARCPVVVIRAGRRTPSEPRPPRVVVGVGATPASDAAVGFAFRAAAQRGIPLAAVHAWQGEAAAGSESKSRGTESAAAGARRALDRALGRWREQFTDVPILARLPHSDPSSALLAESVGAALVVVGSRGRGAVRARLGDSVSRTVLLEARSPVAVVRPDSAALKRTAGSHRLSFHGPHGGRGQHGHVTGAAEAGDSRGRPSSGVHRGERPS